MSSDNLFDRLAELFHSNGPVNWRLAREISESVAGEHDPVEPWLAEEYRELALTAGMQIAAVSPLDTTAATGDVRAVDRRTWAGEHVDTLSYLAEPVAEKIADTGSFSGALQPLGPALLGMQMGSVIGLMSHSVLGQFDIGIPARFDSPVSIVVPNAEAFSTDHGVDPRQTRLWVALHEVGHRAIFAIPWVHEHALMLMHTFVESLVVDPDEIGRRMESFQDPEALQRMLQDPTGFAGLLAGEAQQEPLDDIRALMAVSEGYADHLTERAAPGLLPEAARIRAAIDARRAQPTQGEEILHQVVGLDMQHDRYRLGFTFCEEVERRWGEESLVRLWEGPEMVPSSTELEDPVGWAARVLL